MTIILTGVVSSPSPFPFDTVSLHPIPSRWTHTVGQTVNGRSDKMTQKPGTAETSCRRRTCWSATDHCRAETAWLAKAAERGWPTNSRRYDPSHARRRTCTHRRRLALRSRSQGDKTTPRHHQHHHHHHHHHVHAQRNECVQSQWRRTVQEATRIQNISQRMDNCKEPVAYPCRILQRRRFRETDAGILQQGTEQGSAGSKLRSPKWAQGPHEWDRGWRNVELATVCNVVVQNMQYLTGKGGVGTVFLQLS